nr:tombus P33-like protein [Tolivirales sp.]
MLFVIPVIGGVCAVAVPTVACWIRSLAEKSRRQARAIARELLDRDTDLEPELVQDPCLLLGPAQGRQPEGTIIVYGDGNPGAKISRTLKMGGQRKQYMFTVIADIKVKMGVPENTRANHMVVRRMATDIMTEHGLRPTEQKRIIDKIIRAVFIEDRWETEAREWAGLVGTQTSSPKASSWCFWKRRDFEEAKI